VFVCKFCLCTLLMDFVCIPFFVLGLIPMGASIQKYMLQVQNTILSTLKYRK
jgi:hypothetical protein